MPKGRRPTDRDPPSLIMTRLDSTVCGLWVTVLFYMYFCIFKRKVWLLRLSPRELAAWTVAHMWPTNASARAVLRRYA